jgi:hypothetical protein
MEITTGMNLVHARRVAEWEVTIGQVALAVNLAARLTTVYWQLRGGPLHPLMFAQASGKSLLLIAMVVLYRRYLWPSHFILAVFPVGFIYAVFGLHVSALWVAYGLVMGLGLLLGAHGMRSLRRLRAVADSVGAAI